jgi:ABC-type multidrug transport system fused ATPase/permease subunit
VDVINACRRAFRLVGHAGRKTVLVYSALSMGTAALDMVALLLLVPFLAYLTPGGTDEGWVFDLTRSVLGTNDTEQVVLVLAFLATLLFVVKGALAVVILWLQTGALNRSQVALSRKMLEGYLDAKWVTQQDFSTGEVQRMVVNSVGSTIAILASLITLLAEVAVFAAVVAALLIINPILAISALLYLTAAGVVYLQLVRKPVTQRGQELQVQAERVNTSLVELVGGLRELTIRNVQRAFAERYLIAASRELSAYRLIVVSNQGMRYLLEVLLIGGAALVIAFATLTDSTTTVLVSMGVLLAAGLRLVPSLNTLLIAVNTVRSNEPGVVVLEGAMARFVNADAREVSDADRTMASVSASEDDNSTRVALRDVSYKYPTRATFALESVSLEIPHGETLGVVGSTGSGKSTLVDLLLGLLEPTKGTVVVGDALLTDNVEEWRSRVGFVPQDIFLLDATVRENIVFGDTDTCEAEVRIDEAIDLAQLREVLSNLPDGLDTSLGERGRRLSGGQRQRIGMARALYRRPSVLVLDEATSALDNETERQIGDALRTLHGKMTMIVIAHRLSTVRHCDRIVYLERGRVVGLGTFDDLLETSPGFARLVELGSIQGTI